MSGEYTNPVESLSEDERFDFGDPVELLESWEREQDRKAERDAKNAERGGKKR